MTLDAGQFPHDQLLPCRQHGDVSGWCFVDAKSGEHVGMARCVCVTPTATPMETCPVQAHRHRAVARRIIREAL
jgi:hypothetical protein